MSSDGQRGRNGQILRKVQLSKLDQEEIENLNRPITSTEKGSVSLCDFQTQTASIAEEESRLTDTLRVIEGVGNARVLLSIRKSAQTEYLSDEEKTVILSSGSGRQEPIAMRTTSPEYLGAVIVCEGGDEPDIQWKVLEVVSRFTGLRSDQITVLKLQP